MATTNFVDGTTLSAADWFNDVDTLVYEGASSFATTATAAGTTTLVLGSAMVQEFTGATTQTVVLPVTTTLTTSWKRDIINNSTGALTINSSGANLVKTLNAGERATVTCILASGTTAASWAVQSYYAITESTFTGTLTGVSGSVTNTFRYTKVGKSVTLNLDDANGYMTGTSDATTKTITGMPAALYPSKAFNFLAITSNNGGANVVSYATCSATGVLTFYTTPGAGAWTATGTAIVYVPAITYSI